MPKHEKRRNREITFDELHSFFPFKKPLNKATKELRKDFPFLPNPHEIARQLLEAEVRSNSRHEVVLSTIQILREEVLPWAVTSYEKSFVNAIIERSVLMAEILKGVEK